MYYAYIYIFQKAWFPYDKVLTMQLCWNASNLVGAHLLIFNNYLKGVSVFLQASEDSPLNSAFVVKICFINTNRL